MPTQLSFLTRIGIMETLSKSFCKLKTNGKYLISFVVSLSNHE